MANKYLHDNIVHNTKAAEKIIPFLTGIFHPKSVIDIGCGTGTWLKVYIDNGINNVLGIEGHHLDVTKLVIPKDIVILHDLEKEFNMTRKFDMAMSLEVAEHLSHTVADQFIQQITSLSDVVFFSAAIPFQGGQNHINEQWLSYWIAIFEKYHFKPFDIIRPKFWDSESVEFWYAQNACLFIKEGKEDEYSGLAALPTFYAKDIVHPALLKKSGEYRNRIWKGQVSVGFIIKLIVKKIASIFK